MMSLLTVLRRNLTGVVALAVTGFWLAALHTGQNWWLFAVAIGYFVVVPVVAVLSGDEAGMDPIWADESSNGE